MYQHQIRNTDFHRNNVTTLVTNAGTGKNRDHKQFVENNKEKITEHNTTTIIIR